MVGHRHGLGVTLALVVAGAKADRVDVSPIGLDLGMLQRVAVAFRRGGHQEPGVVPARNFQHVARGGRAGFQRLDRVRQIVLGTGQGSQMPHMIELAAGLKRRGDIAFLETEVRISLKCLRLAADPVIKLSRPTTSPPSANKRSQR